MTCLSFSSFTLDFVYTSIVCVLFTFVLILLAMTYFGKVILFMTCVTGFTICWTRSISMRELSATISALCLSSGATRVVWDGHLFTFSVFKIWFWICPICPCKFIHRFPLHFQLLEHQPFLVFSRVLKCRSMSCQAHTELSCAIFWFTGLDYLGQDFIVYICKFTCFCKFSEFSHKFIEWLAFIVFVWAEFLYHHLCVFLWFKVCCQHRVRSLSCTFLDIINVIHTFTSIVEQ